MTKPEKEGNGKGGRGPLKVTDRLESFLKLMDEENLHELEVIHGDFAVKLVRQSQVPMVTRPSSAPAHQHARMSDKKGAVPESGTPVKSPLAGVFYRSPSPAAPPFVKEGDVVTPDKTLCIIEAMKVLNEINAGVSGRIIKILVENGKPIQSGQTICLVEPS